MRMHMQIRMHMHMRRHMHMRKVGDFDNFLAPELGDFDNLTGWDDFTAQVFDKFAAVDDFDNFLA